MDALLLSDLESCPRRGYWTRNWEARKLHPTEILRRSIAEALTDTDYPDKGKYAGELVMGYAGDRGLDIVSTHKYDIAVHFAALADILTTFLASRGDYSRPKTVKGQNLTWEPYCLQRGEELVRIILVDHLGEERQMSEGRSWFTLGEMAAYKMPLTMEIFLLGASSGNKRHSAWSKGLLHPRNRALRFKKQTQKVAGFKESWVPVWREDYAEIGRDAWLKAMEADGVIADVYRRVHVSRLDDERIAEIRGIIERKTERLYQIGEVPDPNYSACDWPRPCPFRQCCFAEKMTSPEESAAFRRRQLPAHA